MFKIIRGSVDLQAVADINKNNTGLAIYCDGFIWKASDPQGSSIVRYVQDHFLDPLQPLPEEVLLWELEFNKEYPVELLREIYVGVIEL